MFVLVTCNGVLYYKTQMAFCAKYLLPQDVRVCNRHLSYYDHIGACIVYAKYTAPPA